MERKLRVIISTNDQEKFRQLFDRLPLKDGKSVHLMKDYSSYRVPGFEFVILGEADPAVLRATRPAADEIVLLDATSISEEMAAGLTNVAHMPPVCTCKR